MARKLLTLIMKNARRARIRSKLSGKAKTTVLQPVRDTFKLMAGTGIAYRIGYRAMVRLKSRAAGEDDPFALFDEWGDKEDRMAYAESQGS